MQFHVIIRKLPTIFTKSKQELQFSFVRRKTFSIQGGLLDLLILCYIIHRCRDPSPPPQTLWRLWAPIEAAHICLWPLQGSEWPFGGKNHFFFWQKPEMASLAIIIPFKGIKLSLPDLPRNWKWPPSPTPKLPLWAQQRLWAVTHDLCGVQKALQKVKGTQLHLSPEVLRMTSVSAVSGNRRNNSG